MGRILTRLRELWPFGVLIGLLIFAADWSGYNKWHPDLFFPKPLSAVWWHLPIELVVGIIIVAVWPSSPGPSR
jgi:hypothetical protein